MKQSFSDMMQWPEVSANIQSSSNTNSTLTNSVTDAGLPLSHSINNNTNGLSLKSMPSLPLGLAGAFPMYPHLFSSHPLLWSRDEVQQWLKRCIEEYSLTDIQTERFPMNGKALVLLKKEDFIERAPYAGDVLYNILQKLLDTQKTPVTSGTANFTGASMAENTAFMSLLLQSNPLFAAGLFPSFPSLSFSGLSNRAGLLSTPPISSNQSDRTSSPEQRLLSSSPQIHPNSPGALEKERCSTQAFATRLDENNYNSISSIYNQSPLSLPSHPSKSVIKPTHISSTLSNHPTTIQTMKEEPLNLGISTTTREGKSDCRLLWEFISKLLKDSNYTDYIRWENQDDYTFRIVNPSQLSKLWGIQKNRTNMTYEKLSRALRYYYRMDIIEKVPGRRLTYRFMRPPHEIKRGQRGARPGVPRKSRSTDDEAEELYEAEHMSEVSDDDSMAAASAQASYSSFASLPIDGQPLDFSHERKTNIPMLDCNLSHMPSLPKKSRSLSPPAIKSETYDKDFAIKSETYKKDFVKAEKGKSLIEDVKREWTTTTQSSPINGHLYNN